MNNRGRFVVYRPDYPRAYENGIALRAHIVWWLNTGTVVPIGWNIHHRNGDKLDDHFENLELVEHVNHSRLHNPKSEGVALECEQCGREYRMLPGKIRGRIRDGSLPRFCSQECYHVHPKTKKRVSVSCAYCGKTFEVIPSRAKKRKFCSQECSARRAWEKRANR